jgi:thioredoxin-dependent peroxiredoxin
MPLVQSVLGLLGRRRANVAVGQPAPDFTLPDSDGKPVSLQSELAKGPVILAFYPAAFTSGCTHELRTYAGRYQELVARGAHLLAISVDSPETLARFKASLLAPFSFLSDQTGEVSRLYGGTSGRGKSERLTVTIGKDGVITRVTPGALAMFPGSDIAACP